MWGVGSWHTVLEPCHTYCHTSPLHPHCGSNQKHLPLAHNESVHFPSHCSWPLGWGLFGLFLPMAYIKYHWVSLWLLHSPAPGTPLPHLSCPSRHHTRCPTGRPVPLPPALHSDGDLPPVALWMKTLQRNEILAGDLRGAQRVLRHVCSLLRTLPPLPVCGKLRDEKRGAKREEEEEELQDSISEF